MHAVRKLGNNRYIKLPKKKVILLQKIPLGRTWYDKYTCSEPPESLAKFPFFFMRTFFCTCGQFLVVGSNTCLPCLDFF
jgi:hypothetical protein